MLISRPSNAAWQDAFDQTVASAGRDQQAEAVRARYRAAVDAVQGSAGDVEVAFLRTNDDGQFLIDGAGAFAGSVAVAAGFPVTGAPAGVGEVTKSGYVEVSAERLDVVTGDVIVVPARRGDVDTLAAFARNPLWASLPAVQAGRVSAVPNPIYNGGTYVAAELLLRAIADATR